MKSPYPDRQGSFLTEAIVALAIMATMFAILIPNIHRWSRVMRAQREQHAALQALQDCLNIMEQKYRAGELEFVSAEQSDPPPLLSGDIDASLAEGKCTYTASLQDNGWHVQAVLNWRGCVGNQPQQVRLATWFPDNLKRPEGASP